MPGSGLDDIGLRAASEADLGFVLGNLRVLAAVEGRPEAVTITEPALGAMLFSPGAMARCLIVQRGVVPIGHAWIEERRRTFTGERVLYLEDLVILEGSRSQGAGRRAMVLLAALAQREGFTSMSWSVVDDNVRVFKFYERLGARPTGSTAMRLDGVAMAKLAAEEEERGRS